MLRYISTERQPISDTWFRALDYLIGEFEIKVYMYKSNFWVKIAKGISDVILSDKLIEEKIKLYKGDESVVINNTFGYEGLEKYKMTTLSLTSGEMDLFNGIFENESLIFQNKDANNEAAKIENIFKLIYNKVSEKENQLMIGLSRNNGKTWTPYLKAFYNRK